MIVDEALKLVDRNTHEFDWREFKQLKDLRYDDQMGYWLNDYRTGASTQSQDQLVEQLIQEYEWIESADDVWELAQQREELRNSGRSKVESWVELISEGDGTLEQAEQDVSKPTYYKIRKRVDSDRPYRGSGSGED